MERLKEIRPRVLLTVENPTAIYNMAQSDSDLEAYDDSDWVLRSENAVDNDESIALRLLETCKINTTKEWSNYP